MSRAKRRDYAMGKPQFSNALRPAKALTGRKDFISRDKKRLMKTQGMIGDKLPFEYEWCYGEDAGTVMAFTAGSARAQIKVILGTPKKKRLPIGVQVQRVEYVT